MPPPTSSFDIANRLHPYPDTIPAPPSSATALPATHDILRLPDILIHIAPFLTKHHLYTCTLVSSIWRATFAPFLWNDIVISESRHTTDFLTTLRSNLYLVRSLQWNYTEWWELHHVSRERTLPTPSPTMTTDHPCDEESQTSMSIITPPGRLVYREPSLLSFPTTPLLQNLGFEYAFSMRSLILDGPFELIPLLTTLKGSELLLRHLSLKNTNCLRREVLPTIDLVLRASPCLEHCSIRTNAQVQLQHPQSGDVGEDETEGGGDDEKGEEAVSRPLVLKSLELDIRALTGVQLMSVLLQCPDLESFTVTDYGQISQLRDFENNTVFPTTLTQQYSPEQLQVKMTGTSPRDHRPNHIGGHFGTNHDNKNNSTTNGYSGDSNILHLLPTFTHHGGIESVRFGDVALTVLQHCCPRITSLDIGQAYMGKIQSSTLQTLLCSNTGLLHLRTRGVTLEVEDMTDPVTRALLPWTCTNLETLSVAFGMRTPASLPLQRTTDIRLGTPSEAFASDRTEEDESRSIAIKNPSHTSTMHPAWAERTVYRQLSLLNHLHILDIRQSPFMRLQVGTGVELLSSLSMLREFSITGSEVVAAAPATASAPGNETGRMVSEAMDRWFEEHWPSVGRIVVASRTCNVKTSTMVGLDLQVGLTTERRWSC